MTLRFLIFFCLCPYIAFSQKDSTALPSNTIYAEIGGAGTYYSLNYDKLLFKHSEYINFALGFGATYYKTPGWKSLHFIPKANLLFGKRPFFAGIGLAWVNARDWTQSYRYPEEWTYNPHDYFFPYFQIRYQSPTNRLYATLSGYIVKHNITNYPYLIDLDYVTKYKYDLSRKEHAIIWPGLSVGYTFSMPKKKQKL